MREHHIPGMAVAVLLDGKPYYFNYGVASLQTRLPVTGETIFELGSVSKTLTATLGSYAQVTGSLAMSDSASKHLPSLRGSHFDRITLLDLATYTAGGLPLQFPDEVDGHDEMIRYYSQWQPTYPAGTHRQYSNPSIGLFGYLAAQSMGMPFDDLMDKKLFPQLGLTSTFVKVPGSQIKNYAQGYTAAGKPIRVGPGVLDSEAYGVKSNSTDMLKFVAANMRSTHATDDSLQRAIAGTQTGYFKVAGMTQGLGWEMHPYPLTLDRLLEDNSPS
ncbi:MAG: beta-lactamase, partial [Polaromonas sp.]|nr:beta-lactamase [Polaromonas sp.]